MLAVVKKCRTEETLFEVKGDIPHKVTDYLAKEFGPDFRMPENDEEFVNVFETDWYREISAATVPGDVLKIYRENMGLTQAELGRRLGELTYREISDMETDNCCITRQTGEKLSDFFEVPISRFLMLDV